MKRSVAAALLLVALWAPASFARAGVYADDLSKCLVKSTSSEDQTALVVWVFAAMSAHPAIQSYSSTTEAQRAAATKRAAVLMQRLLTVDCRKESVAALKYEGSSSLGPAFNVLGQVAVRGLFSDPHVQAGMSGLGTDVDSAKIGELYKEAGISSDASSPPK